MTRLRFPRSSVLIGYVLTLSCFISSCSKSSFLGPYQSIPTPALTAMGFSQNGAKFAGALDNKIVQIWDSTTGKILGELQGQHTQSITALSWSPDGSKLVTTAGDNTAVVWDIATQQSLWVLKHGIHDIGLVDAPTFSPDGQFLMTRWGGGVIYVWDLSQGTQIHRHYAANVPTFSKDSTRLLLIGNQDDLPSPPMTQSINSYAYIWDFVANTEREFYAPSGIAIATFSADESELFLIENTSPSKLETWNVKTQTRMWSVDLVSPPDTGISLTYQFSDDRKRLLLNWSGDNTDKIVEQIASVWDVDAGIEIAQLHQSSVYSKASFANSDGSMISTYIVESEAPFHHQIELWKGNNGTTQDSFIGLARAQVEGGTQSPKLLIPLVSWTSDGSILAAVGMLGTVKLWDLSTVSP